MCGGTKVCCSFHVMVQCDRQMLSIAVTLQSNFLHPITLLRTALVTRCGYGRCCYGVTLHICTHLNMKILYFWEDLKKCRRNFKENLNKFWNHRRNFQKIFEKLNYQEVQVNFA